MYDYSTTNSLKIQFSQKPLYMKAALPGMNYTIKHKGKLSRIGFKLMDLVNSYYHIDVLTYVFYGINSKNCAYGGLYLNIQDLHKGRYREFKQIANCSSIGPFCVRTSTIPFVGKITDIVFPQGEHSIIVYAYSSLFNLHLHFITKTTITEGIINLCDLCHKYTLNVLYGHTYMARGESEFNEKLQNVEYTVMITSILDKGIFVNVRVQSVGYQNKTLCTILITKTHEYVLYRFNFRMFGKSSYPHCFNLTILYSNHGTAKCIAGCHLDSSIIFQTIYFQVGETNTFSIS